LPKELHVALEKLGFTGIVIVKSRNCLLKAIPQMSAAVVSDEW
jgi:hypothetical protein